MKNASGKGLEALIQEIEKKHIQIDDDIKRVLRFFEEREQNPKNRKVLYRNCTGICKLYVVASYCLEITYQLAYSKLNGDLKKAAKILRKLERIGIIEDPSQCWMHSKPYGFTDHAREIYKRTT